jgi:hypothetical protein
MIITPINKYITYWGVMIKYTLFALLVFLVGCTKSVETKKATAVWCDAPIKKNEEVVSVEQPCQYVMVLFSSTGNYRCCHSFALFAKVQDDFEVKDKVVISWLPKSEKINPVAIRAEEGVNMDLGETFRWARRNDAEIERFGPYVIDADLYNRAKVQESKLKSGNLQFKFNDGTLRPNDATNNTHAISDLMCSGSQYDKFLVTGNNRGKEATAIVKVYFADYISKKMPEDQKLLQNLGCQGIRRID